MSRVVYIGGQSSGEKSAAEVGEALTKHRYEEFDAFTFPYALENPDKIRRATDGVDVGTHSAGMLSLMEFMRPVEVHAFAAPIPTSRLKYIGHTLLKSAQMFGDIRSLEDAIAAGKFHIRNGAELFLPTRAAGHWRPFFDGRISKFNAVTAAEMLAENGARVRLNYGERDMYFQVPEDVRRQANAIPNVDLRILPDQTHDDLVLNPQKIIDDYFNNLA